MQFQDRQGCGGIDAAPDEISQTHADQVESDGVWKHGEKLLGPHVRPPQRGE
jgi:hypothetical protein